MVIENRSVCEGVNLSVLPTDNFKSNLMVIELCAPLRAETATHYSLLTNVLSRCCAEYPSLKSFNVALEEFYAADLDSYVSKSGEVQKVCFKLSCIENAYTYDGADVLAGAMRLLGCMIFKPLLEDGVFPSCVVESEKKNLKEEIESLKEDKARYALNRCIRAMCGDEAYSVAAVGETEMLETIDGAALKACYDKLLTSAPVNIYFVGNTDIDTLYDYCKRYLPFCPRANAVYETELRSEVKEIKRISEKADILQSKLCMAYRSAVTVRDKSYAAMLLACDILGSPCGKLFVNVREKMGLCYYCTPTLDGVKGILTISAGIDAADRERAENAIAQQINDLKNGIISEGELASAKAAALTAYKEIYDSPGAMIGWYATRRSLGLDIMPEDMAEAVKATTANDIAAAAQSLVADTFYMLEDEGCGDR